MYKVCLIALSLFAASQGSVAGIVPDSCYKPAGNDCLWYGNCVEKHTPCEGTRYPYAVSYGQKFCSLFKKNFDWFSNTGKEWIRATMKCLQLKLVPEILPGVNATCKQIRSTAFATHAPCYLHPAAGEPSLCDTSPLDILKVAWTIKDSFYSEFLEMIKGVSKVGLGCLTRIFGSNSLRRLKYDISLDQAVEQVRKRRETSDIVNLVNEIGNILAKANKLQEQGFIWAAIPSNIFTNQSLPKTSNKLEIMVVFAKMYEVEYDSVEYVSRLDEAVQQMTSRTTIKLLEAQDMHVTSVKSCVNWSCNDADPQADAPQDIALSAAGSLGTAIVSVLLVVPLLFALH